MAIVTRYFSTTSAGAGDGTTWADRAMLFPTSITVNSGTWSGPFTYGETVTQTGTGATAVVELAGGSGTRFNVSSVSGSPNNSGVWTGGTSGATVTPTAVPSSHNWSEVIRGFNFSASDGLECRVGPGEYTVVQTMQTSLFASPPTVLNGLQIVAAYSDGTRWVPPDPGWRSTQPVWDTSDMPIFICGTATSVQVLNLADCVFYGIFLKPGPSGTFTSIVGTSGNTHWCHGLLNTGGNSSIFSNSACRHCSTIVTSSIGSGQLFSSGGYNCRGVNQNAGNTGVGFGTSSGSLFYCTSIGARKPFVQNNSFNNQVIGLFNCLAVGDGAAGSRGLEHQTASATARSRVLKTLITNCETGIYSTASPNAEVIDSAINGATTQINYVASISQEVLTGSESLTDLFVDHVNGDYRIKYGSAYWGLGIGAGDEPAPSGGGGSLSQIIGAA